MLEKRALETLTVDSFQPHEGQEFSITNATQPTGLRLISASKNNPTRGPEMARVPFSLMFKSSEQQPLPQGCYRLANEKFGEAEIFLVPISRDTEGITYQAVFN